MNIDLNGLVWVALLALGYFTTYLLIERGLYLAFRREADDLVLNTVLAAWRRDRQVSAPKRFGWLGWLDQLLAPTHQDTTDVWHACFEESRDVARYDKALPVIASLGTALGLLGTFLALKQNAVGAADPTQVIALGIGTSIYGLIIAVAATFGDWLIRTRIGRLRLQTAIVMETLEEILVPTASPPGVAVHPKPNSPDDRSVSIKLTEELIESETTAPEFRRANGKPGPTTEGNHKPVFTTRGERYQ